MTNISNVSASCTDLLETTTAEAMRYFASVCLAIIIIISIVGNSMVCIAFKVNENLRTVSNYFILSLAVSDLITTIFVMPYDLDYILNMSWEHGEVLCQFYTSVYLVSAPASTLNLLAVSIDRWRVINDPFAYKRTTTPFRALAVITGIWVYSTVMAFLPLMGWRDAQTYNTNCTNACIFYIAWDYSIMMSVLNFVVPPLIMTVIYFKIYQIARSHIRRIHRLESITGAASMINAANSRRSSNALPTSRKSSRAGACSPIELLGTECNVPHAYLTVPHANNKVAHADHQNGHARKDSAHVIPDIAHGRKDSAHVISDIAHERKDSAHVIPAITKVRMDPAYASNNHLHASNENVVRRNNNGGKRKSRTYSINGTSLLRKNLKAAKSLAIIVGTFFLCWYPYTITSMVLNACAFTEATCTYPPRYVENLLLILGFLNSMINPFLYALHNNEFKRTYKRILRLNLY